MIDPFKDQDPRDGIVQLRELLEEMELGESVPTHIFNQDKGKAQTLHTNIQRLHAEGAKRFSISSTREKHAPDNPEEVGRMWIKRIK